MRDASGLESNDTKERAYGRKNGRLPEGTPTAAAQHDDEIDEVIARHNDLMNQRKQQNEKVRK